MILKEKAKWGLCLTVCCGIIFSFFPLPNAYAAYPTKPILIIVPYSPGGGSDIFARSIASIMGKEKIIKQPIIIKNMPGGGGAVGTDYLGSQRGNPYRLMVASASTVSLPIQKLTKFSYKELTVICQLAFDPNLVTVRGDYEYNTIESLIEAAKKNPGEIRFGGTGATGPGRRISMMIEKATGAKFNFIPFQSGGEVTTALLGKHIDVLSGQVSETYSQIMSGKFKPLAIAAEERSKYFSDLRTLRECGMDVLSGTMRGIMAPGDMPEEARKFLEDAFRKLDASPQWQKGFIDKLQLQRQFRDGEAFSKGIKEATEEYVEIFKALGLIK